MQYNKGDKVIYKANDNREYPATVLGREIYFDKNFIDLPFSRGRFDYLVEYTLSNGVSTSAFCYEEDLMACTGLSEPLPCD